MSLGYEPKMGSMCLSRGQDFWFTSFLHSQNFPAGTTAHIDITDAAGGNLAVIPGDVQVNRIVFNQSHEIVDDVPHGANYELFVQFPDGTTFKTEYGTVVRKEVRYPLAAVVSPEDMAVQYVADFTGPYVGPKWKAMGGTGLSIHNWPAPFNDPNSLGPNNVLYSEACARWLWPMNMDSVTITVKVLNRGAGKFNVLVCGDYAMHSYLGIQFETGVVNNKVRVITGDGPLTQVSTGTAVDHTTNNYDVYTIKYSNPGKDIACYEGAGFTPVIQWVDDDNIVPHGEGFRYTGLSWSAALLSTGVEPIAWEARDGV